MSDKDLRTITVERNLGDITDGDFVRDGRLCELGLISLLREAVREQGATPFGPAKIRVSLIVEGGKEPENEESEYSY